MSRLHPQIESELARAGRRWRLLRFLRAASVVCLLLCGSVLALSLAIDRGHVRTVPVGLFLTLLIAGCAFLAMLVVSIASLALARPRPWLAAALERAYDPLLDRLNTLVHLEPRQADRELRPYLRRIERQAVQALPDGGLPSPFRFRPTLLFMLAALLAVVSTAMVVRRLRPWERLGWGDGGGAVADVSQPLPEASPMQPPSTGSSEVKAAWGEVRITEPGRDLKVTKVDVVALQVEAASDQGLKSASWSTATNGAGPKLRPLPPPAEPNYAVYKPLLYVDELRLQDWDVVSYFASASTTKGASYASEIYFLEVRPFREDIEKMPGGEDGKAYRGLNELTGLIEGQRQVLRETHRYQQASGQSPEMRRQDRGKLASAESDLAGAVRHLYAKLAAEMENLPIGDVLTHLNAAEGLLERARAAIESEGADMLAVEQAALAELVATRKSFQKVVSDNPKAFEGEDGEDGEPGEDPATAELPDRLKQILELRDKEKAAQELVRKSLDGQRELRRKTAAGAEPADLAAEQEKVTAPLRDLLAAQPKAFGGAEKEAEAAVKSLDAAREALTSEDDGADPDKAQDRAVASLEKLRGALEGKRLANELGRAYRLKDVLDREAREMGRMQSEPSSASGEQAERSAADAKEAARGLKKIVEEKPGKDAFGPGLSEALSGKPLHDLESRLDDLARASEGERAPAARKAKEAVDRLSKAFEESQPEAVKQLAGDRLARGAEDALSAGLAQLDGLVGEPRQGERPSPEDEKKRRREIVANLRKGLEGKGEPASTARLLLQLEEALSRDPTPEEKLKLKKLREEVERFRVEVKDKEEREQDKAQVTRVDPARLPASYRDRIQQYFKKLSEQ